jgi:type IV secretory pathway TraG/TraD family ATPase VirD4
MNVPVPLATIDIIEGSSVSCLSGEVGQGPITILGHNAKLSFDEMLLSKHLLFIGGIGSGKTNAMFQVVDSIRSNMRDSDVMVLFDTKGDYLERFFKQGDEIISNRPDATSFWNVFTDVTASNDDRVDECIFEIAGTLFEEKIKQSNQPFFPRAACDVFAAVISSMLRGNPNANNSDLRTFFDRSGSSDIGKLLDPYEDLKGVWHYISNEKSPQTQGIISEVQQTVRECFSGTFRKAGDFSIRKFVRKKGGKTVFIEYDIASGKSLAPVYRVLIDLAIKESLSRERTKGNVYFVLDEFALLPNLSHIDNGINFGRSLGAKFIVGTQNVGQVLDAYGEGRGTSILSGFGTVFAFRLYDSKSRDFVRNRHGANRKKINIRSVIGSRGLIEEMVYGSVIEDWDLSNLTIGEAIVSPSNGNPFLFRFKEYAV